MAYTLHLYQEEFDVFAQEWYHMEPVWMHLVYGSQSEALEAAKLLNQVYQKESQSFKSKVVVEVLQDYNARMGRF